MKSKLRFGCYDVIRKEHSRRNCPKRRKCSIFKEQYPTGLHGLQSRKRSTKKEDDNHTPPVPTGNEERKDSVKACPLTAVHTEVISICVIPVKVKYKDTNSVYSTFAMLDNCSQGCFVNFSLVKNFRIKGYKTSVSVKTLTGGKATSFAVEVLKVSRTSGLDDEWINIPKAYTKVDFPVDSSEIATPEKIKKWKYLHEISEEISQSADVKVEILIGANCPRALELVLIMARRDGGPYAMKTILG